MLVNFKSIFIACSLPFLLNAQFTKLHDFGNHPDGRNPAGGLIYEGGYFYGMTDNGGANGAGAVYRIDASGKNYSVIYSFNGTDGHHAIGSLVSDGQFLYGVTWDGGAEYAGTIFKLKPDGTDFSILRTFSVNTGGYGLAGQLLFDGTYLYGRTNGAVSYNGVIYRINTDGSSYAVLKSFKGMDGEYPSSLISDGQYLYGMTRAGGTHGLGIIYKIKPDGTNFSKLHDFTGKPDGDNPFGDLILSGSTLYGTTRLGGQFWFGTIFKINTDGSGYAKLFDFDGTVNGCCPFTGLCSGGGFLYGTAAGSGANNSGTLFRIKPDGSDYSKLFDFDRPVSGATPSGALLIHGSRLYGTTNVGGSSTQGAGNGNGVVFAYDDLILSKDEIDRHFMIDIFPNPCQNNLRILIPDGRRCVIKIYNASGQLICLVQTQSSMENVDIDEFASGLYQVHVTADDGSITQRKIIKQ